MHSPHWLHHVEEVGDRPYDKRWPALVIICMVILIGQIDVTIVNVALVSIGTDLNATTSDLQWTMDAYAVTLAGFVLAGGGIADRFGRKGVFMVGLALFGLASLVAPFATEPWHLIACRGLMGLGAAFFFPPALSLLAVMFPPEERGRAIAIWALLGGFGTAVGPVIGGLLLGRFWWGAVFLVNIPAVIVALIGAALLVPRSRRPDADALDRVGAALSILGLAALVFGLIEGPGRGWSSPAVAGALVVGVVALLAFVLWELRHRSPMVDVKVFRIRGVTAGAVPLMTGMAAMAGMLFLLPQLLQSVRGESTIEVGLLLMPFGLSFIPLALFSSSMVERWGIRLVATTGIALMGLGLLGLARAGDTGGNVPIVIGMLVFGAGAALMAPPATAAIMNALPAEQAGDGSAVNQVTRQVGAAFGVAIAGSILATLYASDLDSALSGLSGAQTSTADSSIIGAQSVAEGLSSGSSALLDAANDAFTSGYRAALFLLSALMFASAIVTNVLLRPTPYTNAEPDVEPSEPR